MFGRGVIITLVLLPCVVFGIALQEPLTDTNVIIGDTVFLTGTVTDNPDNLPISWRRQETEEVLTLGEFIFSTQMYVRKRYNIEVVGGIYNLIISNVELTDGGIFEIGYISRSAFVPLDSVKLSVLIPPDAGFPRCEFSPEAIVYTVGETFNMTCQTKGGSPKPDVVWLKNGVEVARTSSSDVLEYRITVDVSNHEDLFECQLDGPAVTETLSCQRRLSVDTPTVDLGPSVVVVDEGSDAIFNCKGQAVIDPTFEWSFPTHILQSKPARYKIERDNTRLTILKTTMQDNNAIIRCEMRSAGKLAAGRSATLLIRPKPTTKSPTTVSPTTIPETTTLMTTRRPTTTAQLKVVATTGPDFTTTVSISTPLLTTNQGLLDTTQNTPKKIRSETYTRSKTDSPKFTTGHRTVPNDIFISTTTSQVETTVVSGEETNAGIPKQKSDNKRKNSQHLGLIFAAATAMIIVLTIVVFAAFCLVICKKREKKDSFNVSNNASSLAGSTGPPYSNGIFRGTSEYHDDYELTDNISQRESQASATESATGVNITLPPEGLYTMPAKLGKTAKVYHPASSSQPDFSTFRLVDESLRNNKALASNSLGRRPRPVPAPKPPRSYGEYENVNRNGPYHTIGHVQQTDSHTTDAEIADAHENTPLQSAVSPDPIQPAIYENRREVRDAVLEKTSPAPKDTSPVVSQQTTTIDYAYEDILKIADSFLHDLEQIS